MIPPGARRLYFHLLAGAAGVAGKLEVGTAIVRAVVSRLTHGRGALHVRNAIVVESGGLRWSVPPFDNSIVSTTPGRDTNSVLPELRGLLAARPDGVCLDIGANLGFVCIPLASEFAHARLVAVEPVPWLATAIEQTARLNDCRNVTVVGRAIAPGERLELAVPTMDGVRFTTLSTGGEQHSPEAVGMSYERFEVPAVTLDALVRELHIDPAAIACIKVDVEGFEAAALTDAGHALSAHPPVLYEALTSALGAQTEAVLRVHGYTRFRQLDPENVVATA